MAATASDLKALLTPEILRLAVARKLPWDKQAAIDFREALDWTFFGGALRDTPHHLITADEEALLHQKTLSALKVLASKGDPSKINVPDLLEALLPRPEDPSFPEQALGLQLVLDQAPRELLNGPLDDRWVYGYFGELAATLAQHLRALPAEQSPHAWARWKDGVSLDYFVWVRMFFTAPIVHHESLAHEAVAMTEELRSLVENERGARDAYRDLPDEERWDLYGFPRMLKARQGPPKGEDGKSSVTKGCFWICALLDVHYPILEKYGRYPYRNSVLGRVSTPDEEAWLKKAMIFKPLAPDVVKRIKDDTKAGLWSPIGTDPYIS
ncbi:uncharacterized protein PG998_004090 [Apiospora kogelbergensis]|uniref:Uncharacterized protein n=1 Tax=Apiospora kogelbergensis TaxID=1337665 RepID=A0AAW0QHH1_9PEZI